MDIYRQTFKMLSPYDFMKTFLTFVYVDAGCLPIIKKRLLTSQMKRKGTVESIFETLCANVYKEVTWKEGVLDRQQRSRDVSEKDLYMEQCYVCGILGYHKFLSLDRLSAILGWQLKPGCYGIDRNTSDDRKEDGNEVEENWSEELINNADHKSYFATNTRSEDLENGKTRKLTSNLPGKPLDNSDNLPKITNEVPTIEETEISPH